MSTVTYNTIEIDQDGKIFAYKAPEKIKQGYGEVGINYLNDQALEAAKRDRVYFKPEREESISDTLYKNGVIPYGTPWEQGKSYPVPEGYSVKDEYVGCGNETKCTYEACKDSCAYPTRYAILVPKEKDYGMPIHIPSKEEFENECLNKPEPVKQQSIEEAAEYHWTYIEHGFKEGYNPKRCIDAAIQKLKYINGFIAGAKSQAAKEKEFPVTRISNGLGYSHLLVITESAMEDVHIGTVVIVPYADGFKDPVKVLLQVDSNDKPIVANGKFAIVSKYIY